MARAARSISATRFIVMTSNLGSEFLAADTDGDVSGEARDAVMGVVRSSFRPEFLNRIDEIILFHRLRRDQMAAIVDIQMAELKARLAERKITLELDERKITLEAPEAGAR